MVQLEQRLFELRAKRNSITPLYQLPNEIIERILLLVQLERKESESHPLLQISEWMATGVRWIRTMEACRRLREVAMQGTAGLL
jgi:hypothetical protein